MNDISGVNDIRERAQDALCVRNLWGAALRVIISDACSKSDKPDCKIDRELARLWLTNKRFAKQREFYEQATGLDIDRIARKLEEINWTIPNTAEMEAERAERRRVRRKLQKQKRYYS